MARIIPTLLTLTNSIFGSIAIMMAFNNQLQTASFLIFGAAILDFFDGFCARLLRVNSEFGKQLDSLADLISFGLAPAAIAQQLVLLSFSSTYSPHISNEILNYISWSTFLLVVFSALRLAKFNTDTQQTKRFIGLPTPANALFWAAIPFFENSKLSILYTWTLSNPFIWICLIIVFCWLLVSHIPMFSLKMKNVNFGVNFFSYLQVITSIVILVIFGFSGFALVIIIYITLSVFESLVINRIRKDDE